MAKTRDVRVEVRLNKAERAIIQAAADRAQRKLSDFIRVVCNEAAAKVRGKKP